ncbi:MAG: hypothetical protein EOP83_23825 [Verrucomicrobiaceae bacterium]|nr:MAG: hypothetical protein EOP83_23825 [Verrucomicrobiaceae bacterium]
MRRYPRSPENGIATFYREPGDEDLPCWHIKVRYVIYPAYDGGRDEPSSGISVDIEWPDNLALDSAEEVGFADTIIEQHQWHEGFDD